MACQISAFGAINELESVKKCLYVGELTSGIVSMGKASQTQGNKGSSNEEDAWGWSVDDAEKPVFHPNWLDECGFSLSPTGELMAITYRQNLVILMSKWSSSETSSLKTKYHMIWHGDPCQEHNELITSVCILPLAAPQTSRSSHSAPDWTCIALGFSTGAIRFYTEKGDLLLSEVLEEGAVVSIKCQTVSPARYTGQPELMEELHVSYQSVVCSIYGFVLSNTLRACRNQLARVQANCSDGIVAPPLSLHKWSLPEQDSLVDCAVGLPQCPSTFTHLHIASVCGGFGTWYRPSPPQSSMVVAAGKKPFVGFHYIVEGNSAPVLTDVVKAVGTKVKSALNQAVSSWFMGGKKPNPTTEKEKVVIEPAESMSCRFGLCDLWRQGSSLTMAPQRNLCVVSDTLGRVTLIDNSTGLALRMWKGYRDAQCGWLTAEEESKGLKRSALFLVIYSPKKGIVEVWAMQQGPRVATFTTSKNGRLFYISHGLLGISTVGNKNPNRSATPCVFVDEFGVLTEINVPFHCVLSDKNSARARDMHLVRKLRQLLRDNESGEQTTDSITDICRQLQTNPLRSQALDTLKASRKISAHTLLEIVESFLHTLQSQGEEVTDPDKKSLMLHCSKLQKLLIFYLFCTGLQQKPPDYNTVITADSTNDLDNLSELLRMNKEDTLRLLKFNGQEQEKVFVKFQEGSEGLPGYLAGFQTDGGPEDTINLAEPSARLNLSYISEVVCSAVNGNMSAWSAAATDSGMDSVALLRLALAGWLSRRTLPSVSDTLTFAQLITVICNIAGSKVHDPDWWGDVRSLLRESTQPQMAVIAAATCKAVALTFEETAVMTGSVGTDDSETKNNDWEKVTQESCIWSLLISQLEDIALINSVLRHKPLIPKVPTLYCLPYDPPEVSLQNICSRGKGCLSELVAKWLASFGMDPTLFLESSRQSSKSPDTESNVTGNVSLGVADGKLLNAESGEEARPTSEAELQVLAGLASLRVQFPYSLAPGVLLANLAWEYVLAWSRQVDNLPCLQAALECLRKLPSPHLRQGVCTLIWTMHLKARFESTLRLINKIGKVPKERLCRQDIGLSELQIADFFGICTDFFDVFMEGRVESEDKGKEKLRHEGLWEGSSLVPPLHQLAINQSDANYDLLLLLSQCARALHLLTAFSLRTHRPLSIFFDSIGQSALFADISAHIQLPPHVVDTALTETRSHFLLRAVIAAIGTITVHDGEYNIAASVEWLKQCLLLAADWSISADQLRRCQCCELYARGFDRLAEEVIVSVSDTSDLGNQLLAVVGHRLRLSMAESNTQLKEQMTHMSPALSSWISSLSEASVESSSLDDTLQLVVVVSSLVEHDSESKRIANLLLDALTPIVDKGRLSDR